MESGEGEEAVEDTGEDEAIELAPEEELQRPIMDALLKAFEEAAGEVDPLVAQHAVLNFALTATHALVYDIAEYARDSGLDVQKMSEEWLLDSGRFFMDGLGNETLLREIGRILGRPELGIRLNRQFRRRLTGR